MTVTITGRHVEVNAAQKKYIERKAERLVRLFERVDELVFTLTAEKRAYTVEASLSAGSIHARTKCSEPTATEAIDRAVDTLEMQALKAKDKRYGSKKRPGRTAGAKVPRRRE
jgi:putative sigma-54 modulation protein